MHVFLWDLKAADCLSNNELLHLKAISTGFLSQESHGLYPADSEVFRVDNDKTRLI